MGTNDASVAEAGGSDSRHVWALIARIAAIVMFVAATNSGFGQRILLVIDQGRLITLVGFVGLWGLSLACLLIAALQPDKWLRAAWALVIALSTAVGFAFRQTSGSELSMMDVLSLWSARHEASRAADFYAWQISLGVAIFAVGFAIFAAPPAAADLRRRRWLRRLAWAPVVPIVCTGVIMLYKEGGGSQALPTQFAPVAVAAVSATVIPAAPVARRSPVLWQADKPLARHLVLLVDESVRGDYIDWSPGNPYTPELARLKDRLIDYGPAASGGVCSHYSNALLRFMGARHNLGRQLLANPTIWDYAKTAGFRTVFIDAQAGFNRNPGKLQNFMTAEEAREIDGFYALSEDVPVPSLDDRLLDIVIQELRSPEPVLIYANKNGAHFPYDRGYPATEAIFRPTVSDGVLNDPGTRVNSYRNVVRWSVDRFFKRLFEEADLKDTVIIYTSDHGQLFDAGRLTHCSVENPNPREALVPLWTSTTIGDLRDRFSAAAERNHGRATHFLIAPAVLELLGYAPEKIRSAFGKGSLFDESGDDPVFTSGDVFELFSTKVRMHPIDLSRSYLEAPSGASAPAAHSDSIFGDRASLHLRR